MRNRIFPLLALFLVSATDDRQDLMSIKVEELNQRSPIYIGSRFEVEKAREFQA